MGNIKHCDVDGCTSTSEEFIQGSWWKVQRMDDDYSGKHDLCPKHAQLLESMEWKTGENSEFRRQLAEANEAADGQRGIESSWEVVCLEGTELQKVLGPGAKLKEIKIIQVRIFYEESTQDLWVQRDILLLGSSERSKILEWIQDESAEGVAEYMAKQVDAVLSRTQLFHFATGSVGGLDLAARDVANLQDGWHEFFIGGPTEKLASALGLSNASLIGDVAGSLPLPSDRLMGGFRLACEIGAVATVMVTGPTPLVLVSGKLLLKDVAHRVVVKLISALLTGNGKQPEREEPKEPEATWEDQLEAVRATSPPDMLAKPQETAGHEAAALERAAAAARDQTYKKKVEKVETVEQRTERLAKLARQELARRAEAEKLAGAEKAQDDTAATKEPGQVTVPVPAPARTKPEVTNLSDQFHQAKAERVSFKPASIPVGGMPSGADTSGNPSPAPDV